MPSPNADSIAQITVKSSHWDLAFTVCLCVYLFMYGMEDSDCREHEISAKGIYHTYTYTYDTIHTPRSVSLGRTSQTPRHADEAMATL